MLTQSDTEVVRQWLAQAIEAGRPIGQTPKALADHCGVTPQAITGWLKTGRITKTNLTKAAAFFGHSPLFGVPVREVRQPVAAGFAPASWPFPRIDLGKVQRLSAEHHAAVEAALIAACAVLGVDVAKRLAA
jgi:hypothetical protein